MQESFPFFYLMGWALHMGLKRQNSHLALLFFLLQGLLLVHAVQSFLFCWEWMQFYTQWTGQPLDFFALSPALQTLVGQLAFRVLAPLGLLWPKLGRQVFYQILLALGLLWALPWPSLDASEWLWQFSQALAWLSLFYGLSWFWIPSLLHPKKT